MLAFRWQNRGQNDFIGQVTAKKHDPLHTSSEANLFHEVDVGVLVDHSHYFGGPQGLIPCCRSGGKMEAKTTLLGKTAKEHDPLHTSSEANLLHEVDVGVLVDLAHHPPLCHLLQTKKD